MVQGFYMLTKRYLAKVLKYQPLIEKDKSIIKLLIKQLSDINVDSKTKSETFKFIAEHYAEISIFLKGKPSHAVEYNKLLNLFSRGNVNFGDIPSVTALVNDLRIILSLFEAQESSVSSKGRQLS